MKMLWCLFLLMGFCACQSQEKNFSGDALEISDLRSSSNKALRAYDVEAELSFLTDNISITTGAGTQISGKENFKEYLSAIPDKNMYWVRTPHEIEVNQDAGLAWESGTWKGYNPDTGNEPVVAGKYAAQWTKHSGGWKIKSELFVMLSK